MAEKLQESSQDLVDFLIIGQGIAGSILSLNLIKAGFNICVINDDQLSTCSKISAGIWNPIVFKRLVKSWMAQEIIPELLKFYSHYEKVFNAKLITTRNIIKPINDENEKKLWFKKSEIESKYLAKEIFSNYQLSNHHIIPSYSKVLQAGNLNVSEFLSQTKKYISNRFQYLNEPFLFSQFQYKEDMIHYHKIKARQVVFCEGYLMNKNPFFNWVPTKPAKGELITIHCPELKLQQDVLNKGIFILPLGNNYFKVGSTYQWDHLNDEPTSKGQIELETKLKSIITNSYSIIKHEAGVRPSVIDRRPVMGRHPDFKNMFLFNGFGTKAVMLAPYFANQLTQFIQNGREINVEVDVKRFDHLKIQS
ncbi:MAG: FAD-dependent oxidoreductase [Bacteroidota bacterium]